MTDLPSSTERPQPGWLEMGIPHLWMPYTQMKTARPPLPVVATEGVYLTLADGRQLLDGLASWWTVCHGYNHPHILSAVRRQLETMPHVMFGGICHEPASVLAIRLARLLPGDLNHVFFSDSGSVAVEVALKMAVQFWGNQGQDRRQRFVCFRHAYHGDTTGAMSVGDLAGGMHACFAGFLLEQFSLPVPASSEDARAFDQFLRRHGAELAAVIIEPLVQAAGGMKFQEPESLRMISAACRRNDVLLIADEIATGFGRTGSMFACQQAEVVPDIMCIGKALTAGTLGMGATVATTRVFEAFLSDMPSQALMHGPTFMANPLACAAANASLDLFEREPRLDQVRAVEQHLRDALPACRQLPGVVDVRVKGAIGVVQVERLHHPDQLQAALVDRGVWLRPFADVIYLTPPLTITPWELEQLCRTVVDVVAEWSTW